MPSLADYLALVPPQHVRAPRFMATLTALLQPLVDQQALLASLPNAFDLDLAVGKQLDAVGLWVGVSRYVSIPLLGTYFSFDDPTLGWGEAPWKGPYDASSGQTILDDTTYRLLIRAKIAANSWDGTLAGAAAALGYIFSDPNTTVFIQDNQDMTYSLNVAGVPLRPTFLSLLTGGYIPLKPAGVRLAYVNQVSVGGAPLFGFDLNTNSVAGFGRGAWGGNTTPIFTLPASRPLAGLGGALSSQAASVGVRRRLTLVASAATTQAAFLGGAAPGGFTIGTSALDGSDTLR